MPDKRTVGSRAPADAGPASGPSPLNSDTRIEESVGRVQRLLGEAEAMLGRASEVPIERAEATRRGPVSLAVAAAVIGTALFSSGGAGLVNQVVWQRSLKVFLGGSETISSMVVVLVFMGGLGVGSLWMGRRARRFRNPLGAFAAVELLLACVNFAVCGMLAADLSHSVFAVQRVALSIGIPLLVVYAAGAVAVLTLPCLLMGATMPLAAEACQRSLGLTNSRLLGLLFFVNTLGSVLGTVASSGFMIAQFGLTSSLIAAAGMNLAAGGLLAGLAVACRTRTRAGEAVVVGERRPDVPGSTGQASRPERAGGGARPARLAVLAFGLGFCSLAYEMYLLRLIPLRHQPLPFTFAAVIAGFLMFWSLGAAWSARRRGPSESAALRWCGLLCGASIAMFAFDSAAAIEGTWSLARFVAVKSPYFLPCLLFGYLFGRVTSRAARSWGHDVGRICAWNTCGSCLGILLTTLIGYELPFYAMLGAIVLLVFALQEFAAELEPAGRPVGDGVDPAAGTHDPEGIVETPPPDPAEARRRLPRWSVPLAACGLVVAGCMAFDVTRLIPGQQMYSGRDGVIVLTDEGDLIWDGLWHSRLSRDNDHVGTRNWHLAVAPVICHRGEAKDVCVIGVGTGITTVTLGKLSTVRRVDAYDISRVLERVYRDHPDGTLRVAGNPKIRLIWQDARTGLVLNPRKYDIIQAQPLYLKQAGSSLLNSVEFLKLVESRLKPGGVFCLYSNGSPEQAYALRSTADAVFACRESFFNGYLLVLSNDPIELDESRLAERLSRDDPLWREIRGCPETATPAAILQQFDRPRLPGGDPHLVVTDDFPILEYPAHLSRRIAREGRTAELPEPQAGRAFVEQSP